MTKKFLVDIDLLLKMNSPAKTLTEAKNLFCSIPETYSCGLETGVDAELKIIQICLESSHVTFPMRFYHLCLCQPLLVPICR